MFVVFGFQVPHKAKDKQDCERGICFLCFDCIDYGPEIYKAFDDEIEHVKKKPLTSLLTPLASCLANDLELPEEILEMMDDVYPLEKWCTGYNQYHSDTLAHANPEPGFFKITTSKALSVYFQVFNMYPDVVIKDRLDGAESLWNVFSRQCVHTMNDIILVC